ncbi:MAG: hypothetical protein ABFS16_14015 [Bacteroidota bacterium]
MNRLFLLIFVLVFLGCTNHKKQEDSEFKKDIKSKISELDSLKNFYPDALKPLTQVNWVEKYGERIRKDNINFKLDTNKVISYFIVPLLLIHSDVLIKDSIDLLSYMSNSKLTIDGAECYVLENEIPVATFSLYQKNLFPVTPRIFKDYVKKRNISEARRSGLYFKLCIQTNSLRAFIPGIVYLNDEGNFQFLNYSDNQIYPVKELYRTLFDNEELFRQYINKFVKE